MSELTEKLQTMTDEQIIQLYKNAFNTPGAKLVLEDLRNRCFIKTSLPLGQEGDRAEGMRQVVLHIQTQLDYKPEEKKEIKDD